MKRIYEGNNIRSTYLCIIVEGGEIAFFQNFHPQYHINNNDPPHCENF